MEFKVGDRVRTRVPGDTRYHNLEGVVIDYDPRDREYELRVPMGGPPGREIYDELLFKENEVYAPFSYDKDGYPQPPAPELA